MKPSRFLALVATAISAPSVVAQQTTSLTTRDAMSDSLQVILNIPCASTCLLPALQHSQCKLSDQKCMCQSESLKANMTGCIMSHCSVKDSLKIMNATATGCGQPVRDRGAQYALISNVFGVLSAFFVVQRFGYKLWASINFGLDDWFTLGTIIIGIPVTVINAHGVIDNGLGRDIWTLTYDNITNFSRYFYILEIIYFAEVSMLKLSLLFFYLRIFPSQMVKNVLWGTIVFNICYGIAFTFASIFQCQPISFYWVMWDREHEGRCNNINIIAWSNAAISIALDIWMLAIPLSQLRHLNLDWRKKIGVVLMFSVGTFVTIVSILRLKSLVSFGSDAMNPTWDFYNVGIWSTVEINVGIICVCMPSVRLLLARLFPRIMGTTRKYYASATGRSSKRASRPPQAMGNTVSSQRGGPVRDLEHNQIACERSFAVEYDHDEMHLVFIKDLDRKSTRSDAESSTRLESL